jgi:hypothetical protein
MWDKPKVYSDLSQRDLSCGLQFNSSGQESDGGELLIKDIELKRYAIGERELLWCKIRLFGNGLSGTLKDHRRSLMH